MGREGANSMRSGKDITKKFRCEGLTKGVMRVAGSSLSETLDLGCDCMIELRHFT